MSNLAAGEDHVCSEITYTNEASQSVHSDLCADISRWNDAEYRQFLHDNLDEFLNAKDANGLFYVGNVGLMTPEDDSL